MFENAYQKDKGSMYGGVIGVLAGLWGIVVTLIFTLSQIQMISRGTPVKVVLQSNGVGFLDLALHLVAFALVTIVAYSALTVRLHRNIWSKLFILISIVFIGLSLIPGSTIGMSILPAAVGILASGLFLNWSPAKSA